MDNELRFSLGEDVAVELYRDLEAVEGEVAEQLRELVQPVGGWEHEPHVGAGRVGLPESLLQEMFSMEGEGAWKLQMVVTWAIGEEMKATVDELIKTSGVVMVNRDGVGENMWRLATEMATVGDNVGIVVGLWPRMKNLSAQVGMVTEDDPARGEALAYRVLFSLLRGHMDLLTAGVEWFGSRRDQIMKVVAGDERERAASVLRWLGKWQEQLGGLRSDASGYDVGEAD